MVLSALAAPAIGAGLAGIGSLFAGAGKKEKFRQYSTLLPGQQQLQNQFLQYLQGATPAAQNYLSQMLEGSPESYEKFAAPYIAQFQQRTIPALAERFAGIGAQSSSAFQQALGQSASDLQLQLAALREGLRGQSFNQYQNLLGMGLTPTSINLLRPGTPSAFQNYLGSLGSYFGGR